MEISRRASERSAVAPFLALEVMNQAAKLAAEGRDIVRLEVGQPAEGAPKSALRALSAVLEDPLGYTTPVGRIDLRERIADWTKRRYGVDVPPRRVIVTTGSSAAFQLAFLACFDVGARLGLADPGYPSYRSIASALGLEPVRLETQADDAWAVTPTLVAEAARAGGLDGLLVASPANPTGAILPRAALAALIAEIEGRGGWYISDEIYHGLEFGAPAPCALEVSDDAIVINSFSKYFRMTGWRLGWMIAPERLVDVLDKLAQHLFISPPHVSQIAAAAAFDGIDALETSRLRCKGSAELVVRALSEMGFADLAAPSGAFYVYAGIAPHLRPGEESPAWCAALLDEAGVAVTPGVDFDPVRGGRTIRVSVAGDPARIAEGVARLRDWLERR